MYGCALPTGHEGDAEYDIYAEGLLFAPKDTVQVRFAPKDNLHGIGYKGMLLPETTHASKPGFSGNLKIKGQVGNAHKAFINLHLENF